MSLDEGYIRHFSPRVGKVRGVEVRVHWMLIAFCLLELLVSFRRVPPLEAPFSSWLAATIALLVSIFLHELGHCYAAFREGGSADRIVLWPLGGLAFCDVPRDSRSELLVAAAGPAVNALLLAGFASICFAAGWNQLPFGGYVSEFPLVEMVCQQFVLWNVFLLFLNLIPCYPLDGARMFQAFLWAKTHSHGQATLLMLRVSQVFAMFSLLAGFILAIWSYTDREFASRHPLLSALSFGFLLVGFGHFIEGRMLQHRLIHGEEEEGVFGYDFSHGYTSLERTTTRGAKRTSFVRALRERYRERARAQRREKEAAMRQRVDDLLQKIHEQGMGSLTGEERRFLAKASERLRK